MVKIALDAGHGIHTAGKRTPAGEREWSFNNKVLLAATAKLNKYDNVQILRLDDPTGVKDISLTARTNAANRWSADALVSIHHNALKSYWGEWGGVETYVHPTARRSSFELANEINPRIVEAMGLRNRGVKQLNLHMVRESNMTAILTEGGFMDSNTDIEALRSDAKLKAQGVAIADGLIKFYGLKPKSGKVSNPKPPSKPTSKTSGNLGLVDWMKSKEMDSSFGNRGKLYGSGYAGTAIQNTVLLNKLQNKPVSKPVAKKNTVTLPRTAKTWRTYKLNVQPVKANSDWSLTPSAFGGLTYEILGRPYANVVTINTGRGKRNIFVGPGTGAVIK